SGKSLKLRYRNLFTVKVPDGGNKLCLLSGKFRRLTSGLTTELDIERACPGEILHSRGHTGNSSYLLPFTLELVHYGMGPDKVDQHIRVSPVRNRREPNLFRIRNDNPDRREENTPHLPA